MESKLPVNQKIIYSIGQLGWSILINIVSLQLVYFYMPPQSSGLPFRITQITFLGILNIITIVAASGRLFDAITDPLIATLSDRWKGKRGRRTPFMLFGAIPSSIFCFLMFLPPLSSISIVNIIWLFFTQALFYLFLTIYVTPFFALLPEIGHSSDERLDLSTYISITYALGIIIAGLIPNFNEYIAVTFKILDKTRSLQISIGVVATLAAICMLLPGLFFDEKKYSSGKVSNVPMREALKRTFKNENFRYYVVADFSYFVGITIIMTGLIYYITVLLELPDTIMGILLPLMVIISFIFYPFVNFFGKKYGKKLLIVVSFFIMSLIFFAIFFLGKFPFSKVMQAYFVIILYSIPLSFLGVLPNSVLADIAEIDAIESGINQEGMFFASRTLMQKMGQTIGVFSFAALTSFGKDIGNDFGIRLSGLLGFVLCLLAGIIFMKYKERYKAKG